MERSQARKLRHQPLAHAGLGVVGTLRLPLGEGDTAERREAKGRDEAKKKRRVRLYSDQVALYGRILWRRAW